MKKIFIITMAIFIVGLSGCQSKLEQEQVKLIKVAPEVIDQYDCAFLQKEGIYTFENKNYTYIVFENMHIDPDQIKLKQDGSVSTIYISFDKINNEDTRYVYKYINRLDDEDKTLIVSDGKKEYLFNDTFIIE